MLASANAAPDTGHREVDVDDLLDDPELERLHAERLAAMQKEAEKRMVLQRKGHGELQEVWHLPCDKFSSKWTAHNSPILGLPIHILFTPISCMCVLEILKEHEMCCMPVMEYFF